jgi:hypothetical protein
LDEWGIKYPPGMDRYDRLALLSVWDDDMAAEIIVRGWEAQDESQPAKHSDLDGWRTQFMADFGTTGETVAQVEVERVAKALRQRDGTIDSAELDTVIAIVSGQRPKNELEAMTICQMAVTHGLTMRSLGNLNRSNEIQQQDSNALAIARLTKAFASQVDALPSFVVAESSGLLSSTSIWEFDPARNSASNKRN